jgi:hypothetical protein
VEQNLRTDVQIIPFLCHTLGHVFAKRDAGKCVLLFADTNWW